MSHSCQVDYTSLTWDYRRLVRVFKVIKTRITCLGKNAGNRTSQSKEPPVSTMAEQQRTEKTYLPASAYDPSEFDTKEHAERFAAYSDATDSSEAEVDGCYVRYLQGRSFQTVLVCPQR